MSKHKMTIKRWHVKVCGTRALTFPCIAIPLDRLDRCSASAFSEVQHVNMFIVVGSLRLLRGDIAVDAVCRIGTSAWDPYHRMQILQFAALRSVVVPRCHKTCLNTFCQVFSVHCNTNSSVGSWPVRTLWAVKIRWDFIGSSAVWLTAEVVPIGSFVHR